MCTVSWNFGRSGYDLFFSRDELHTRARETPPAMAQADGVAFLAPNDGDHGGTWLLANEFGLTFCLLNDYGSNWRPPVDEPRFSRGHLVLACAAAKELSDAAGILCRQPLGRAASFHLVGLAPDTEPLVLHWDGTTLNPKSRLGAKPFLTSSSYATQEVVAARQACFANTVRSPFAPELGELEAFHHQYSRAAGPHSVLMCRPDASTRSISHIIVRRDSISMGYEPIRWEQSEPVIPVATRASLARRNSVGNTR